MKRMAVMLVALLALVPLSGCQWLLLPFLGAFWGGGCTPQDVPVPDGTPNTTHLAGTYTFENPASQGPIELDLTADRVDADRYDVTGSATVGGTDYAVDGEVLAGSCERFVAQGVTPQSLPPDLRTLALRLTEPAASEAAYTIVAVRGSSRQPAYLVSGPVTFSHPLRGDPGYSPADAGHLDLSPFPY